MMAITTSNSISVKAVLRFPRPVKVDVEGVLFLSARELKPWFGMQALAIKSQLAIAGRLAQDYAPAVKSFS